MAAKFRVFISDFQHGSVEIEERILGDIATVEALDVTSEEQMWGRADEADAVMVYHTIKISQKTIERLSNCKLIVRCGVGFDNVDYKFARSRGIPVANVPDYGTEEVADSAIGLTLALTRGIAYQNVLLRSPDVAWHYDHVAPLRRLRGRTFGVIGLGRIGTAAAVRAKALGMDVVFYDPYKSDGYDKALGVRRCESLEELLTQSFVVSCHCPLTPETQHLINAAAIARMPRGSYLVNTARGGIVDINALPDALASGQLAGAGIDVLPQEPPDATHPLIVAWRDPKHPAHLRLILNAHNAFYSEEGLADMRIKGSEACRRALLGQPLRNVVN
ncbi:MAG TPA: C-terminal binding protein [Pirellulaceae bacterium]|nr:C-terminal binding protein [Pirellulaceae bacterium]